MTRAAKKRPGRPRKGALERPEQFSIRLTPQDKLLLEGVARYKNDSISRAVGHLLRGFANELKIDGKGLRELFIENMSDLNEQTRKHLSHLADDDALKAMEQWQKWFYRSSIGKLFVFPKPLLDDEESKLVDAIRPALWKLDPKLCDQLAADVKTMIALDIPTDEIKQNYVNKYIKDNAK